MSDDLVKQSIAELQDVVRCRCHPAYKDRGLRDPSCECDSAEAVKVVADRIEELEDKLAKAVEHVSDYSNDPHLVEWANATLAELKGDT